MSDNDTPRTNAARFTVCTPESGYEQQDVVDDSVCEQLERELAAARAELEREKVRFARMQESFQRENDAKTDAQALLAKCMEDRTALRAELAEARECLRDIAPLVRHYAAANPRWTDSRGCEQDPYGAHAWLKKHDSKAAGAEG